MENVPQVHSVKNKEHFDQWIAFLESKGYSNHWQDLNAKDYGIPQSRNRCYMVSILGEHSFEFPKPIPLNYRLGDLLEQEVDKQFYLTDTTNPRGTILQREVCNKAVGLTAPYEIIDYTFSNARLREIESGTVKIKNKSDPQVCCTLTTNAFNFAVRLPNGMFRCLTPIECWRLMGFDDNDFTRAARISDDKHLYFQAGNSIVVNVLMAIFKELFLPKKTRSQWLDELLNF